MRENSTERFKSPLEGASSDPTPEPTGDVAQLGQQSTPAGSGEGNTKAQDVSPVDRTNVPPKAVLSKRERALAFLNRVLLVLAVAALLAFILQTFTQIAEGVLAAISTLVGLIICLFPTIKEWWVRPEFRHWGVTLALVCVTVAFGVPVVRNWIHAPVVPPISVPTPVSAVPVTPVLTGPVTPVPTATATPAPTITPTPPPTPIPTRITLTNKDFENLAPNQYICGSKHQTKDAYRVPSGATQLTVIIVIPSGSEGQGLHGPVDSALLITVNGQTAEEKITETESVRCVTREGQKDCYKYEQGQFFSNTFDVSGQDQVRLTLEMVGGENACLDFWEVTLTFR